MSALACTGRGVRRRGYERWDFLNWVCGTMWKTCKGGCMLMGYLEKRRWKVLRACMKGDGV
jgi:hypothetical protein